jgi:hypothetical protein
MVIRKFIEEIGEKVLPPRRRTVPAQRQQQQHLSGGISQYGSRDSWQSPFSNAFAGVENECAVAIRRYLATRSEFTAPSDLVVLFNELDDMVILAGTVRDEQTRDAIIQAAGNIQGVERVDDRMTVAISGGWR